MRYRPSVLTSGAHALTRHAVRNGLALAMFGLSLFAGNASFAQTPDGETPANEGVCDVLQGGTPGLYGTDNQQGVFTDQHIRV